MMRTRIHRQSSVGAIPNEIRDVGLAGFACNEVIGRTMKHAYWRPGHDRVLAVAEARRVNADMSRESNLLRSVHLGEANAARVDGRDGAFREAHDGDAVAINAWMPRHGVEGPVRVHHHGEGGELSLIVGGVDNASGREAVEKKRRDAP
jgi:hypothetical protein